MLFPISLVPLFQSESKCETILMKMPLIYMKMKLHAELIFIWKVSHLYSYWNGGTRELDGVLLLTAASYFKHYVHFIAATLKMRLALCLSCGKCNRPFPSCLLLHFLVRRDFLCCVANPWVWLVCLPITNVVFVGIRIPQYCRLTVQFLCFLIKFESWSSVNQFHRKLSTKW